MHRCPWYPPSARSSVQTAVLGVMSMVSSRLGDVAASRAGIKEDVSRTRSDVAVAESARRGMPIGAPIGSRIGFEAWVAPA